ncbi:ankyrin repeat family protein [Fowlpox virus]|uniref:Putative ankyrin repeat protein FPV034 n=2 Tax=Fowlpox virus TaxID=10261 RepID=V034_FOWPN|nr:Ankyrin repeat gene family protein [Fowlpox virus]Q9J5G9.1 RecName: Full=Putative ankyrin repeat protein FPV034 [Fowlpox virus strain NVSL]UNS14223.1 ALPV-059 [Albatrosspox virus]CAE52580.1 putative ankyrin-repeat protein [Fowlpox virus isolate HP-438/Munich]AAF44378.1 ORF FPV034 Ankyrin repeat gene family protein [Fowlpox virus]ART91468.1 ankyrin repeat family protein [Fowlpox virus]AXY04475.1 ankyrin repeat protein [Fowlpox virus]
MKTKMFGLHEPICIKLLEQAIELKDYIVVRMILNQQENINTYKHFNMLRKAVLNHDHNLVNIFIDKNFNINIADSVGYTLLRYAVEVDDVNIAKILLDAGSIINKNDYRLLHSAITHENKKMIELLCLHGININVKDDKGYTALYYTICNNNYDMVCFLLEKNADISIVNKYSMLHFLSTSNKYHNVMAVLLDKGIDVNIINHVKAPIHVAVERNNIYGTMLLINRNADVNIKELHGGRTSLHLAIKERNYEAAFVLINNGANVDSFDDVGNTPIFIAASLQDVRFMKLLLDNGADINVRNVFGETPVNMVITGGSKEVTQYTVSYLISLKVDNIVLNDFCAYKQNMNLIHRINYGSPRLFMEYIGDIYEWHLPYSVLTDDKPINYSKIQSKVSHNESRFLPYKKRYNYNNTLIQ